jgi:2Fe-2S ferredoxin
MPTVIYKTHDGGQYEAEVPNGSNVMVGALDNMIDGILGECGGACACATCHCYVDEAWVEAVGAAGEMEQEMLTCVVDPQPNSRLGCQIVISDQCDGLVVSLPASQY